MSPPPFYRGSQNLPVAQASFQRPPKAPIVNPYEKFTQPQFDAWIGDITGALRDALGYRAEPPSKPKARTQWHIPQGSEPPDATDEDADADAELDDSFAEVRARRAAAADAKGKGRDPREGPGLGRGERGAPIEIDLDSEEEDQEEEEEEDGREDDEWEDEEGMRTSDEEDEEEANAWRNGESSARAHARYQKYAGRHEDGEDEEEDEERDDIDPDAIEVVSDDEPEDEGLANGLQSQNHEDSGEEYSDEENANPTSLLIGLHRSTHVAEHDYNDVGEETGSESENEADSPLRQAGDPHVHDDIFGEEDDELDGVGSSPARPKRGEAEIIDLESDEEEVAPEDEENLQGDEEFALEGEQDEEAQYEDPRFPLHLSPDRNEENYQDDDFLPGSSPILSSPVEPEHAFQSAFQDPKLFNVDEPDEQMDEALNQPETFDWNYPPAFPHGVPASGPGHLATPAEDDDIVDSDDYPRLEVFGTSDQLPMFQSPSQMRTEFEAAPLQFEEESQDAEPFSQGYVVTEVEEHEQDPENLQDVDAYTMSRSISVEPHHFTVEESFTDHEPDDRGMSIDVVTVDEEMEDDRMMPGEGELGMDIRQEEVAAQDSLSPREEGAEDTRKLTPSLGSPRTEEVDGQTLVEEPQITVQQNGNGGSNIPLPVLADPTVHDLFPSGHPTISFPASLLKAPHMRQESSLFTPLSEAPSAVTTPHSVDYSLPADPESIEVAKTEKADAENTINGQSQATRDGSAEAAEDPVLEAGQAEVMDVSVDADKEIGNSALVIQQDSHTVTDAAATELNQLTPIEEISSSTANEPYEGDIIYATLPDEVTAIAPDLDGAAPLDSAQIEDHVVENESQANGTDLTLVHEEDHLREDSSTATAYPTKMTLAASATPVLEFDPYPYSLSTPGERLDPMEQEEASVSSASTGGKDSEDRTEGEDATSAVTSQENDTGDMDEMQLQYPIEPDVKATPDIQLEAVDAQDGEMDATEAFNGVGDAEGMDLHPITESDVKDIQLETDLLDGEVDAVEALDTTADEVANAVDGEVDAIEASDAADDISEESETDAHGDEDPDYEDSSSSVGGEQDENDIEEAPAADAPAMAPFSLAVQNDAEEAPEEHQPSQEIDESIREPVEASTVSIDVDATPEEITGVPGEENGLVGEKKDVEVSDEVSSSIPDPKTEPSPQLALEPVEAVNSEEGIVGTITPPQAESPPAESASLKRKREHSLKESTSNIGKMAESRLTRRYSLKSNGKGKAKEEYFDDTSSNSSASSAARLLDPGSRGTSRASSVASVRSTKSSVVVTGSSPSLPRVNSIIKAARPPPKLPSPKVLSLPPPAPPPPQLMHAHSHNRAVRPPTFSRHTTHQGLLQRTPSRASVNEDTPIASTSSMSTPAPPRRSTPAANSPVTRSNCRYHKISLPEDDETKTGPRVFFVVPGCSLGDSELMKEEDIQDMGDATMEDAERMINDLDSLHFNSYLIGILRHLVGVDILREQEVYYLPRPGEERLRKPVGRDRSKLRVSSGGSFASDGAMSPVMRSPASVSSRPPTSIAGSSSTASVKTTTRRPKKSDRGSPTPSWGVPSQGDVTDDESPAAKRVRAAEAEGVAAAASGSPLRTRRSKRIDKEAAEYKPDVLEAVEESSDEDADNGRRKKKKRGVKRGRQSEAVPAQEGGAGDDRKTKKLKTRESVGGS